MFNRLKSKKLGIGSLWVVALIAVLGLSAWGIRQWQMPPEPVYRGKKLTEYQAQMFELFHQNGSMNNLYRIGVESGRPFLQPMGTNALPFLLKQIQAKDSDFEIWLRENCSQRGWKVPFPSKPEWYERQCAVLSFGALKEQAYPAVPELLRLARQDKELRPYIVDALTLMGRDDRELLDMMVELVRSDEDMAGVYFMRLGSKAKSVAPEIRSIQAQEQSVGKTNDSLRFILHLIER